MTAAPPTAMALLVDIHLQFSKHLPAAIAPTVKLSGRTDISTGAEARVGGNRTVFWTRGPSVNIHVHRFGGTTLAAIFLDSIGRRVSVVYDIVQVLQMY